MTREDWFYKRQLSLMEIFIPSKKNIKKIIEMNDGLHERFRNVYDDMLAMKKIVDDDIKRGVLKCTGYRIYPEYFFVYGKKGGTPIAGEDLLVELSDATIKYPYFELTHRSDEIPSFEEDFLNYDEDRLYNIGWLDYPGQEGHYIYLYMFWLFLDVGIFCPLDITYLTANDLEWQIVVEYEHYNKK